MLQPLSQAHYVTRKESERSCIDGVDYSNEFWNCSDGVISFVFHFMTKCIPIQSNTLSITKNSIRKYKAMFFA
jgi:hypothetical protein